VLKLYTQPCSKTASQLLLDVLETLVEKNLESPRYIACVIVDNVHIRWFTVYRSRWLQIINILLNAGYIICASVNGRFPGELG